MKYTIYINDHPVTSKRDLAAAIRRQLGRAIKSRYEILAQAQNDAAAIKRVIGLSAEVRACQ